MVVNLDRFHLQFQMKLDVHLLCAVCCELQAPDELSATMCFLSLLKSLSWNSCPFCCCVDNGSRCSISTAWVQRGPHWWSLLHWLWMSPPVIALYIHWSVETHQEPWGRLVTLMEPSRWFVSVTFKNALCYRPAAHWHGLIDFLFCPTHLYEGTQCRVDEVTLMNLYQHRPPLFIFLFLLPELKSSPEMPWILALRHVSVTHGCLKVLP